MIGTEQISLAGSTQSVSLEKNTVFIFGSTSKFRTGKEIRIQMQAGKDKRKICLAGKRLLTLKWYRWTAWKFVRPGQKWLNSGTF